MRPVAAPKIAAPKIASPNIALRRLFVFGATALLSALAAYEMYQVLAVGGLTTLEAAVLALFVILFAWIAFSFASTLGGVLALMTRKTTSLDIDPDAPLPAVTTRTALLLPTYNEPPDRVMSRVQAVYESMTQTGCGSWFDVFILSDTTDPDIFIAEEAAFLALRTRLEAEQHLLPPPAEERRQEGRQHRRVGAPLRRRLHADDRARRRLADDRRHAGAPGRRDGAKSRRSD